LFGFAISNAQWKRMSISSRVSLVSDSIQGVIAAVNLDPLQRLLDLTKQLHADRDRLVSELEDARDAALKHKQQARLQARRPFSAVLIDGDGYIFQALMNKELELEQAGTQAATQLEGAIKDSLRRQDMGHCDIVVHVYANVSGLSRILAKAGRCGGERRALGPFVAGFNRNNGNFDFVDAGDRKENADAKVRAKFDMYAENVHCQQIYFAGCHDSGYASMLTSNANQKGKITLLRHTEFHPQFQELGFGVEAFDEVFLSGQQVAGLAVYARANSHTRAPSKYRSGIGGENAPHGADNGRFQGQHVRDRLQKEDIPEGMIPVNVHNQRLDPPLPKPSKAQLARWNGIYQNEGLCVEFHLHGRCGYARCKFKHQSTTEEAKYLLEYTSRSRPCPARRNCRYLRCTRGHVCQKQECEYNGGTQSCKLPKGAHGGDLKVHQFVKGVGDVEHTITSAPGYSRSPLCSDHGPESDGSEEGKASDTIGDGGIPVDLCSQGPSS
jgi:hypothetical protein